MKKTVLLITSLSMFAITACAQEMTKEEKDAIVVKERKQQNQEEQYKQIGITVVSADDYKSIKALLDKTIEKLGTETDSDKRKELQLYIQKLRTNYAVREENQSSK